MATEKERGQWLMLGAISEKKRLGLRFQKESGELFADGNQDSWAKYLREISRELLLSAKQMREEYDTEYPNPSEPKANRGK